MSLLLVTLPDRSSEADLPIIDPDVEAAKGVVNFKLEDKALLDSVIQSLAGKAKLTQRGDAYYRPKQIKNEI